MSQRYVSDIRTDSVIVNDRQSKTRRHAQWLEVIAQWQESGLSEQIFCESMGACLDTFRKHRYQANKGAGKSPWVDPGLPRLK